MRRGPITRLLVAALLLTACGADAETADSGDDAPADGIRRIVSTTAIWADVVDNVDCNGEAVHETVIPAGADPHAYEPSLADRATLERSMLVVANGADLEGSLADTIAAVDDEVDGELVFVATDEVTLLEDGDPHIWQDPTRVAQVVDVLAERVAGQAGVDTSAVATCVADYKATLAKADGEAKALLDAVPAERRKLVTNHDALRYFAEHYGFTIVGTVIPSPSTLSEASPAELEELAKLIETEKVPAIFAEDQHSDADAKALADRLDGAQVAIASLYTDTLGEPGSGAETLAGMWVTNARIIADALRGTT